MTAFVTSTTLPLNADGIGLRGRITGSHNGWHELDDGVGNVRFQWPEPLSQGAIVQVHGATANGVLAVDQVVALVQPERNPLDGASDWACFHAQDHRKRKNLEVRAQVLKAIRTFFEERGFLEVETPYLDQAGGQESTIELFRTQYTTAAQKACSCWLMPSPELHMKRLLGSGFERIYQIGRAFRNGERTDHHNPEFTMLEWYRAYHSYDRIMQDLEALVAYVVWQIKGHYAFTYQGQTLALDRPWKRLQVVDAMIKFAGIDLTRCADRSAFYRSATDQGITSVQAEDSWEDLFFKVFIERVEPALQGMGPVLLMDYPACMASLARLKEADTRWAERVEGYLGGLELANGYAELNDPVEQRRRFLAERARILAAGREALPLDEAFLQMMEAGMPPATGMALGIDRLVMLCADAPRIDDVLAFPFTPEH